MGLALMEEVSLGMSPGLGSKVTTLLLSPYPGTRSQNRIRFTLRNKLTILTMHLIVFAILQLRAIPYRAQFLRLLICVYGGCCSSWQEPEIALVNQTMLPFDVRRIDQVSPSKSKETLGWRRVLVHRNT